MTTEIDTPSLSSMTRTNWKMSIEYLITHVEGESESSQLRSEMLNCMQWKFWRITEAITALEETMYNFIKNQPSSSVWCGLISSLNMTNYWSIMMGTITGSWALAYRPSTSVPSNYFIISSVYKLWIKDNDGVCPPIEKSGVCFCLFYILFLVETLLHRARARSSLFT